MEITDISKYLLFSNDKRSKTPIKDGDIFKIATLKKNIKTHNYFKKCYTHINTRHAVAVFIILKKIDNVWNVYEIDEIKKKISVAKKYRTLTELFQNKGLYGMIFYGNLFDGDIDTDNTFQINDEIIEHFKNLFNEL